MNTLHLLATLPWISLANADFIIGFGLGLVVAGAIVLLALLVGVALRLR